MDVEAATGLIAHLGASLCTGFSTSSVWSDARCPCRLSHDPAAVLCSSELAEGYCSTLPQYSASILLCSFDSGTTWGKARGSVLLASENGTSFRLFPSTTIPWSMQVVGYGEPMVASHVGLVDLKTLFVGNSRRLFCFENCMRIWCLVWDDPGWMMNLLYENYQSWNATSTSLGQIPVPTSMIIGERVFSYFLLEYSIFIPPKHQNQQKCFCICIC